MDSNFLINDYRKPTFFSKKSFSGYIKKDVINTFNNNLILSKLHDACYLGTEMHISLYQQLLLENLFVISSHYINLSYPILPNLLYSELIKLNKIKEYVKDNRNDQETRNSLTYLISIVSLSPKNSNFQIEMLIKMNDMDFEIFMIKKNIKFNDLHLVTKLFFPDESKEIVIVVNEIANLIRSSDGTIKEILYWISWLVDWEKKCKKDGNELIIRNRKIEGVTAKNTQFWEWIIWSVFINEAYYRNKPLLYQQVFSLYNLYKFNFKKSYRKKYLIYIIHSIFLFKKKIDWELNPLKDKHKIIIQANFTNNKLYRLIFQKPEEKFYLEKEPLPEKKPSKTRIHIQPKKETKKDIEETEIKKRMSYLYI